MAALVSRGRSIIMMTASTLFVSFASARTSSISTRGFAAGSSTTPFFLRLLAGSGRQRQRYPSEKWWAGGSHGIRTMKTLRAGAADDYLSSLSTREGSTVAERQTLVDIAQSAVERNSVSESTSLPEHVDPNSNESDANKHSIRLARSFLEHTCPSFLSSDISNDEDRLVKIGRSIEDLVTRTKDASVIVGARTELEASLSLLIEECTLLASGRVKVPTVRFGKTELEMPILSLGCMRFQQAWGTKIETMDDVTPECQQNLINILKYASALGVSHIETARGYGSSELQIGEALRTLFEGGELRREDLIIQTKVPLKPTAAEFRDVIERSFRELQLDYVDLLGLHGLNLDVQYDLLFNNGANGNLIDVVHEYMAMGKIRHLGFSTHARPELIRRFVETGEFEYVNLHYHWCGSYTASGDGKYGGNLEILRLLKERDMGAFIISAFDKGGMLYAPSKKLRSLTLPDFEPIAFGCHFLWDHKRIDKEGAPCHTISCGAARPSDLDQAAIAAYMHSVKPKEMAERVDAVTKRLHSAQERALGADWMESWHEGLPNFLGSDTAVHHCNIVWLYNLIQSFGMLEYSKARYSSNENNRKKWNSTLSNAENVKNLGPSWGWTPGNSIEPGADYSQDFINVPEKNKARVAEAVEFVHKWCSKDGQSAAPAPPSEWESSYDMRPWAAFPERG